MIVKIKIILLLISLGVFFSCNKLGDHKKTDSSNDTGLMLSDIPYFDTTGKQSIFKNISPYEVKGIEQPESNDTDYDKPYNSFEFITNAYNELTDMGYSGIGSVVEFSRKIQDTIWANTIYDTLRVHSSEKYLGTKRNFIDSVRKISNLLSKPIDHSDSSLRSLKFIDLK